MILIKTVKSETWQPAAVIVFLFCLYFFHVVIHSVWFSSSYKTIFSLFRLATLTCPAFLPASPDLPWPLITRSHFTNQPCRIYTLSSPLLLCQIAFVLFAVAFQKTFLYLMPYLLLGPCYFLSKACFSPPLLHPALVSL